jgi:hypothetical protein
MASPMLARYLQPMAMADEWLKKAQTQLPSPDPHGFPRLPSHGPATMAGYLPAPASCNSRRWRRGRAEEREA